MFLTNAPLHSLGNSLPMKFLTVFPRPDPFSSVLGTLGSSPHTYLIMAQGYNWKENGSEEQREETQRRINTHWATKKDGGHMGATERDLDRE